MWSRLRAFNVQFGAQTWHRRGERRWNINGQSGLTQNEFWQSLEKDSAAKKTQKRHQPS
jgi:hypothetical protein